MALNADFMTVYNFYYEKKFDFVGLQMMLYKEFGVSEFSQYCEIVLCHKLRNCKNCACLFHRVAVRSDAALPSVCFRSAVLLQDSVTEVGIVGFTNYTDICCSVTGM